MEEISGEPNSWPQGVLCSVLCASLTVEAESYGNCTVREQRSANKNKSTDKADDKRADIIMTKKASGGK